MCCTRRDSVAVLPGVIQTCRFKQFDLDQRGFRSETLLASLQIVISLSHLLRNRVHLCAVHSRLCASAKSDMSLLPCLSSVSFSHHPVLCPPLRNFLCSCSNPADYLFAAAEVMQTLTLGSFVTLRLCSLKSNSFLRCSTSGQVCFIFKLKKFILVCFGHFQKFIFGYFHFKSAKLSPSSVQILQSWI